MNTSHKTIKTISPEQILRSAQRTLDLERAGLDTLLEALDGELGAAFAKAVRIVNRSTGRMIVTGMGKSGHIGQKAAATLASTGTPAFFVHPSEASHGDLGMITREDVVLALSWSGETVELGNIITYSTRFDVPLLAVTSRADSTLAKSASVALVLPLATEACPHGLAPTTSTTMQLAIGDCLAIALLESKGFTARDFKVFHPGGQLGANLQYVADMMHTGERLPLVADDLLMSEALVVMTEKSLGCLGIIDSKGHLAGIITDGDLRRKMGPELLTRRTGDIMTPSPKTAQPDMLVATAMEMINSSNITALFVVKNEKPVGVIHIHDLLRAGVA